MSFRVSPSTLNAPPSSSAPEAKRNELPWQQRIISGPKSDSFAKEVGGKPISHADREEMRKLLEQIDPPTNSRH